VGGGDWPLCPPIVEIDRRAWLVLYLHIMFGFSSFSTTFWFSSSKRSSRSKKSIVAADRVTIAATVHDILHIGSCKLCHIVQATDSLAGPCTCLLSITPQTKAS